MSLNITKWDRFCKLTTNRDTLENALSERMPVEFDLCR